MMRIQRRAVKLAEFPIAFIGSIVEMFRKPPTTHKQYLLKPPTSALDMFDLIDKGVQRQSAETDAENIKLQHEIERIKESKNRDEYTELNELAREHFRKQKKAEKMRTLKLKIEGEDNYPVWFLKNDHIYKNLYLKGFRLYQTPEGYLLWFPWLTDKSGKSYTPVKGSPSFNHLFKSSNPVTQLKGGKFDSNYIYDAYNLYLVPDNKVDAESGQPVNIINLSDQERQQFQFKLEQLKEQYSAVYHELEKTKDREIGYIKEINDAKLLAGTQGKLADSYSGGLGAALKKTAVLGDNLVNAMTTIQDSKIDQLIAENSVVHLKDSVKALNAEVANAMKDMDSPIRRKVDEKIKDTMDILDKIHAHQAPPPSPEG